MFFAVFTLPESPPEVIYWTPPTTINTTAIIERIPMTPLIIPWMAGERLSLLELQPLASLTSAGRLESQTFAKTGEVGREMPIRANAIISDLAIVLSMGLLYCFNIYTMGIVSS